MSRRTPGVSKFLATGNAVPHETAVEVADDWDADLARFTNADFNTDFDSTDLLFNANALGTMSPPPTVVSPPRDRISPPLQSGVGFITEAEYAYAGASPFDIPTMQPVPTNYDFGLAQSNYKSRTSPNGSNLASPTTQASLLPLQESVQPEDATAMEESARIAAEEDKRRRNTAASARFRVKKKQREQALEKTADQLKGHVSELEARIKTLEAENSWLKSLVVVKKQ